MPLIIIIIIIIITEKHIRVYGQGQRLMLVTKKLLASLFEQRAYTTTME